MAHIETHHAIIDTPHGNRYVLLRYSASGFSHYDLYRVYRWNGEASKDYITVRAYKTGLKRYAPYLYNNIGLVSFGISVGLVSPFKDSILEQEDLDKLFQQFKKHYDSGLIDSNLFVGP